ncbi:MAG TPA: hypothetical protein VK602_10700 [Phyllobacterium sp.]|nr:hypothetical protein [Phyllobacterium sp.]
MKPFFTHAVGEFLLEVFYEDEHHRFRLNMWRRGECQMVQYIPATYEPLFGIDVADMDAINDEAEVMCRQLEAQP